MPQDITVSGVMEFLLKNSHPRLPPEGLAEVFDRLLWCLTEDAARELVEACDAWLRGDSLERAKIALAMDSTFPFGGGDTMLAELDRIAARWPELRTRCEEIVATWEKTNAHLR